jgi:hypothetical protein
MTAEELVRLEEIKTRLAPIHGFEHKEQPGLFPRQCLAELDKDGKWRCWDQNIALSADACRFIAAAPDDIKFLLTLLNEGR